MIVSSYNSQRYFDNDGRVHATQLHNHVEALDVSNWISLPKDVD